MAKVMKRKYRFFRRGSLHRFVYGRWTTGYVDLLFNRIVPVLGNRGKRRLANSYHSKILTQRAAEEIITLDRDIPLQDLETIIPYEKARNILLSGPPDIAVFECGCRLSSDNPCYPTQVCMVVGQPFVNWILHHRPKDSRRLTTDEALTLLREEHERGHIHSAWFKHAMMNRFYAICNCCKCHCGGIEAMTKYGVPMIAPSGHSVKLDDNRCNDCGACVAFCPFGAMTLESGKVAYNLDKCMGCGVCIDKCTRGALELVRDSRKGTPLEVDYMIM
jgi:Pyruvate/2-oxoacid:ferredoxin oxidoreductase delta subunit